MQGRGDIIAGLPDEIISDHLVLNELAPTDIANCLQVSRQWHRLFSSYNSWIKLIERDFGIPLVTLRDFNEVTATYFPDFKINYHLIYKNLHILKTKNVPFYPIKNYPADLLDTPTPLAEWHLPLLACCTLNEEIAQRFIPKEEYGIYEDIAIKLDAISLFLLLSINKNEWIEKLDKVIRIDRAYQLANFLITPGHDNSIAIDIVIRWLILEHGNEALIDSLLNIEGERIYLENLIFYKTIPRNKVITPNYILSKLKTIVERKNSLEIDNEFIFNICKTNQQATEQVANSVIDIITYVYEEEILPEGIEVHDGIIFSLILLGDNAYPLLEQLLSANNNYDLSITDVNLGHAIYKNMLRFVSYLLEHHIRLGLKLGQNLLDNAFNNNNNPEIFKLLLDSKYGLKPTSHHLLKLIERNCLPLMRILVEEFKIPFTNEMLTTAVSGPRQHARDWHFPDLDVLQYMLEPRFGLTLSQQHFDIIFQLVHNIPCNHKQYINAIKFVLEPRFGLTLSQDMFEKLITLHGAIDLIYLLNESQYHYLRPTRAMLLTAIKLKKIDHIQFLLTLEFFQNIPNRDLIIFAINADEYSAAEYLVAVNFSSLANETVSDLIYKGNFVLAEKIIQRYPITSNLFFELIKLMRSDTFHPSLFFRIKLGFNLMQKYRVYPDQDHLSYALTRFSDNTYLAIISLFLNPTNQIEFNAEQCQHTEGWQNPSIQKLLTSDVAIREALLYLKENNDIHLEKLQYSYNNSPRQCVRVATYVLAHPEQYGLNPDHLSQLFNALQTVIKLDQLSLIEQREIKQHLASVGIQIKDISYNPLPHGHIFIHKS